MNKFLLIAVITGVVGFSMLLLVYIPNFGLQKSDAPSHAAELFNDRKVQVVMLGRKKYTLYVSEREQDRISGLSNVKNIHDNEGMLFQFDTRDKHSFWMKDMNMSLDMIFMSDGTIVDIKEYISPQTYPQTFMPAYPANQVIELLAGEVRINGMKVGDQIELK